MTPVGVRHLPAELGSTSKSRGRGRGGASSTNVGSLSSDWGAPPSSTPSAWASSSLDWGDNTPNSGGRGGSTAKEKEGSKANTDSLGASGGWGNSDAAQTGWGSSESGGSTVKAAEGSSGGWDASTVVSGWRDSAAKSNDSEGWGNGGSWGSSNTAQTGWSNKEGSKADTEGLGTIGGWGNSDTAQNEWGTSGSKAGAEQNGWGSIQKSWASSTDTTVQIQKPPQAPPPPPRRQSLPTLPVSMHNVETHDAATISSRPGSPSGTDYSSHTHHRRAIPAISNIHAVSARDFIKVFSDAVQAQVATDHMEVNRNRYTNYQESTAMTRIGFSGRKIVDSYRKELDAKVLRRTTSRDAAITQLTTTAPMDAKTLDLSSKLDTVLLYCGEVQDFVGQTKPLIERLSAPPAPPAEPTPRLARETSINDSQTQPHGSSAISHLQEKIESLDDRLDEMETDVLLRIVPEPTAVKVNKMIDIRREAAGILDRSPPPNPLEHLAALDREQGHELARQADLTASAILAQREQKQELEFMASQLSQAQEGLVEAKKVAEEQAAQIAALAKQLLVVRERAALAAQPKIDPKMLLGEAVGQATAALMSYTQEIRTRLGEQDEATASLIWQAMEPARQLTLGVCSSMF